MTEYRKNSDLPASIYTELFTNPLLTERKGRTGEYWPEVVTVRTERSEVSTKTTEGQYFPVRSRASEVSKDFFFIWHHFLCATTLPIVPIAISGTMSGNFPLMMTQAA